MNFLKAFLRKGSPNTSKSENKEKLIDGELPFGWIYAHRDFIEPRDKKIMDLHIQSFEFSSIDDEKNRIELFLNEFYKYKKECEDRGECYIKYFFDMFENCHNSKNPCFSLDEPRKKRLKYINDHYDELIKTEKENNDKQIIRNKILKNLPKELEDKIKLNQGILQSELIKMYDPIVKYDISNLLYQWDKEGKIFREKSGRSYKIRMKDE